MSVNKESRAALLTELRAVIDAAVRGGFATRREIIDEALDFGTGDELPSAELEAFVETEADLYLAAHYIVQKYWPGETDCDRLDDAFAALDRVGIVARHNFTCCQSCGHAEIAGEIGAGTRGYAFYHSQDLETVVHKGYLYLAYGDLDGTEEGSAKIGHEICETLRQYGLEPDWNGSVRTRICLRDITWKRRRVKELDND